MYTKFVKDHIVSITDSKITKDLEEVFSLLDLPTFSNEQVHIVLVEGLPGVDTSVLLEHISYLWLQINC